VSETRTITVTILDKDYQVACPADQEAELVVSASYLDKQMRSIRENGKVIGHERIAVMAALNISHELLQASEQNSVPTASSAPESAPVAAVAELTRKVDEALHSLRQLEIG
jgi:cell division protein ZapA